MRCSYCGTRGSDSVLVLRPSYKRCGAGVAAFVQALKCWCCGLRTSAAVLALRSSCKRCGSDSRCPPRAVFERSPGCDAHRWERRSAASWPPVQTVIPAKAGIQRLQRHPWIEATRNRARRKRRPTDCAMSSSTCRPSKPKPATSAPRCDAAPEYSAAAKRLATGTRGTALDAKPRRCSYVAGVADTANASPASASRYSRTSAGQASRRCTKPARSPANSARVASSAPGALPARALRQR